MLTPLEILNNSGLLIIEKNSRGEIVNNLNKESLQKYNQILKNAKFIDNCYYDSISGNWYNIKKISLFDKEDLDYHEVIYINDISNFKKNEEFFQIDKITNLANKDLIKKKIIKYLHDVEKSGENFSIMFMDLDYYKQINDTYGHLYGDFVLSEVGKCLNSLLSEDEVIVGRFGGDEFVFVLKNCDQEESLEKARQIHSILGNINLKNGDFGINHLSSSVGVYHINGNEVMEVSDFKAYMFSIMKKADKALYYSKNNGKGFITDYNDLEKVKKIKKKKLDA